MTTREKYYEADNRTSVNHEGANPNTPVQRLTATSIIGDAVEDPHGAALGKIKDLMINLAQGHIEYVVIEFGAFLGMGGKLFAIPFSELKIDPAKRAFILDRDKEQIKRFPGFDKTHWPDTNEHDPFGDVIPPFP